ncbi:Fic family protein [Aquipuribacter hungaricus]|uniref:Fic family protein n=1 Tax=Aquipuribacter hungaricus TaxID=545624 RepID=A0ABV7WHE6_9MICO
MPEVSPRAWAAVAQATGALGQLRQACASLPNPRLLIQPALIREALDTSALEGTYAALPEVLEARLPQTRPTSAEVLEIRAYERMANAAFEWVTERPLSVNMLCDLQGILAEGSRVPVKDAGQVRRHQVVIGPRDCTVREARYIPPPPDDRLTSGLEQWTRWINADSFLPGPLKAAVAHYQFESLHPFGDGNGRVGRLVATLQLLQSGDLKEPAITLSPWFLKRRTEYQDHLLRVSQTGEWDPWVEFFCLAICEQARRAVSVVDQLMDWLSESRAALNSRHWSGVVVQIVEDLIDWPMISMPFVAEKYGVSGPTAKSAVDRLVEVAILKQVSEGPYRRIFGATPVMDLVESL